MKTLITIILTLMVLLDLFAQETEHEGNSILHNLEQTPLLDSLYERDDYLSDFGTAEEIDNNRLAIKAAWEQKNPEVAMLFKKRDLSNINYHPDEAEQLIENSDTHDDPVNIELPRIEDDILVHDGVVEVLDVEVARNEDIYVLVYEDEVGGARTRVYRSVDHGSSFNLFALYSAPVDRTQLEFKLVTNSLGEGYYIYLTLSEGNRLYYGIHDVSSGGGFNSGLVATNVEQFSLDISHTNNPGSSRAFVNYVHTNGNVYSIRTTAGFHNENWVDEHQIPGGGPFVEIDNSYGRSGDVYTAYTGGLTGNLYAKMNDGNLDPTRWEARETVELGSNFESTHVRIASTRKSIPTEEVIIVCSQRTAGATNGYDGVRYLRENGNDYSARQIVMNAPNATRTGIITDVWVNPVFTQGNDRFQMSYIDKALGDPFNGRAKLRTYDNGAFEPFEQLTNQEAGYLSAVAEYNNEPCIAFARTVNVFGFPANHGVYFTYNNLTTSVDNSLISQGFKLNQNFPNPANGTTSFSFSLPQTTHLELSIFDLAGRKITQLVNEELSHGNHSVQWDFDLTPGIYFYAMKIGDEQITRKMIIQ